MTDASIQGKGINASQLKAFARCDRLQAFQYMLGIPSVGDALALGTAVHGYLENFLRSGATIPESGPPMLVRKPGRAVPATFFPGTIARRGVEFLPPVGTAEVETKWAHVDPTTGIRFHGTIDFLYRGSVPGADWAVAQHTRWVSGAPVTSGIDVIGDHKTTAGAQWALDSDGLSTDIQFVLYAWGHLNENPELDAVKGRWVYYPKRATKGAGETIGWPVDVVLNRAQVSEAFAKHVAPLAAGIIANSRRLGLSLIDPRDASNPIERRDARFKLHVLNQLPFQGYRDNRCDEYGGCWFKSVCFAAEYQFRERKGPQAGTCDETCDVGSCSNRAPELAAPGIETAPAEPGLTTDPTKEDEAMVDYKTDVTDSVRTAAAWAKVRATPATATPDGLAAGWRRMDAPNTDYVFNWDVSRERSFHVQEYADTIHPAAPAQVNPPAPAAPPVPVAPAPAPAPVPVAPVPVAPVPVAPVPAPVPVAPAPAPVPVAPIAPAPAPVPVAPAPVQIAPAPAPVQVAAPAPEASPVPGALIVQPYPGVPEVPSGIEPVAFYFAQSVARGLIPAGRPGRKPSADTLKAILTHNCTLESYKAAQGTKGDDTDTAPVAPPAPAQVAAPPAPVAPDAAPSAPAQVAAPKARKAKNHEPGARNVNGFVLCVNTLPRGNRPRRDFSSDVYPVLAARIAETPITLDDGSTKVFADFRLIPYGRGRALIAAACAEYLANQVFTSESIMVVDTRSEAACACLDTLREFASEEFTGVQG